MEFRQAAAVNQPMSQSPPMASIVIPVPPSMSCPLAIKELSKLDYPRDRYEVIVARGYQPSRQRNAAAREATGEILLFLDDDSLVDANLLKTNTAYFSDESVACVGGPNIEADEHGVTGRAINCVLASLFGDFRGCKRFARRGHPRAVGEDGLILCNVSVRRDIFDRIGGFPEQLYPNEENAFFSKVTSILKGSKLMYVPDAFVRRSRPSTSKEFVRKVFGYGVGRLNQTFVRPTWVCAIRLLMGFFPLYWIAVPLISPRLAFLSLVVYAAGDALMAAKIFVGTRSVKVTELSALLFPAMHLAYGCGILWGFLSKVLGLSRVRPGAIEVIHVKRFEDDEVNTDALAGSASNVHGAAV